MQHPMWEELGDNEEKGQAGGLLEKRHFRALLLVGRGMARSLHWEMPCTEESKLGRELLLVGAATLQCWALGQGCASRSGSPFALSLLHAWSPQAAQTRAALRSLELERKTGRRGNFKKDLSSEALR